MESSSNNIRKHLIDMHAIQRSQSNDSMFIPGKLVPIFENIMLVDDHAIEERIQQIKKEGKDQEESESGQNINQRLSRAREEMSRKENINEESTRSRPRRNRCPKPVPENQNEEVITMKGNQESRITPKEAPHKRNKIGIPRRSGKIYEVEQTTIIDQKDENVRNRQSQPLRKENDLFGTNSNNENEFAQRVEDVGRRNREILKRWSNDNNQIEEENNDREVEDVEEIRRRNKEALRKWKNRKNQTEEQDNDLEMENITDNQQFQQNIQDLPLNTSEEDNEVSGPWPRKSVLTIDQSEEPEIIYSNNEDLNNIDIELQQETLEDNQEMLQRPGRRRKDSKIEEKRCRNSNQSEKGSRNLKVYDRMKEDSNKRRSQSKFTYRGEEHTQVPEIQKEREKLRKRGSVNKKPTQESNINMIRQQREREDHQKKDARKKDKRPMQQPKIESNEEEKIPEKQERQEETKMKVNVRKTVVQKSNVEREPQYQKKKKATRNGRFENLFRWFKKMIMKK
jgi:hypothetical protein